VRLRDSYVVVGGVFGNYRRLNSYAHAEMSSMSLSSSLLWLEGTRLRSRRSHFLSPQISLRGFLGRGQKVLTRLAAALYLYPTAVGPRIRVRYRRRRVAVASLTRYG
jgi:hypothetical protein